MQSRRIRQSSGHKTDRQTTEGLGENRPIGRSLYPERNSKQPKKIQAIILLLSGFERGRLEGLKSNLSSTTLFKDTELEETRPRIKGSSQWCLKVFSESGR